MRFPWGNALWAGRPLPENGGEYPTYRDKSYNRQRAPIGHLPCRSGGAYLPKRRILCVDTACPSARGWDSSEVSRGARRDRSLGRRPEVSSRELHAVSVQIEKIRKRCFGNSHTRFWRSSRRCRSFLLPAPDAAPPERHRREQLRQRGNRHRREQQLRRNRRRRRRRRHPAAGLRPQPVRGIVLRRACHRRQLAGCGGSRASSTTTWSATSASIRTTRSPPASSSPSRRSIPARPATSTPMPMPRSPGRSSTSST